MPVKKKTKIIKSVTRNDGKSYSLSDCVKIQEMTRQDVKGYCVQFRCASDNELTMANSDTNYRFIAAHCVSDVVYCERVG